MAAEYYTSFHAALSLCHRVTMSKVREDLRAIWQFEWDKTGIRKSLLPDERNRILLLLILMYSSKLRFQVILGDTEFKKKIYRTFSIVRNAMHTVDPIV